MEVDIAKKDNDITIITISGRLDANTSPELQKKITEIVDRGELHIIMKLTDLVYISSAGLRVLITTVKILKAKQGKLVLCELQDSIHEVLKISGFTNLFNIQDNEGDAQEQF